MQTTIGKLCTVFEKTNRDFVYGRITYVDYRSGVSTEFNPERESDYHLLLRPFFLKRREYESEQEVRFVTAASERAERGGVLLDNVSPQDWILAIRLWPGITRDEERALRKAIEYFLPAVDCKKSDLLSGPDGPSDLVETFRSELEQSEDSKWTKGDDGIPNPLKRL